MIEPITLLNIAFYLLPGLQVVAGQRIDPQLSKLACCCNLGCAVLYLLTDIEKKVILVQIAASFAYFLANGYILIQCFTVESHNPINPIRYPRSPYMSRSPLLQSLRSCKSPMSETMVFDFDEDQTNKKVSQSSHGPVLATLLSVTPVGSNAMPIGTAVQPQTIPGGPAAPINYTLVILAKIAQLYAMYSSKSTDGISVLYYPMEILVLLGYLFLHLTLGQSGFIYLFSHTWQLVSILGMNLIIFCYLITHEPQPAPGSGTTPSILDGFVTEDYESDGTNR